MKIQQINQNYYNTNSKLSFKGLENPCSLPNSARMTDQFIRMAKVDTGSNEEIAEKGQIPSTPTQIPFANNLAAELKEMDMGLKEIEVGENGILMATLPSNIANDENLPVIGLIAHMDTSSAVPTGPVNPQFHKNYQGGDIKLNEDVIIAENDLKDHKGEDVITSDGTTLLGADDKAGIAEIIEALNVYKDNPEIKHPKIRIAFTPDEETGLGVSKFDIKKFGVDVAYTLDGGVPKELETETFNAYNPEVKIKGINIHPGFAYGKMVNAILIAADFIKGLPKDESPAKTQGRQGYYHPNDIKGDESEVVIKNLVRDFDSDKAKERVKFVEDLAKKLEEENPGSSITVTPKFRYGNMKDKLQELPEVVDYAKEGLKRTGLDPEEASIRGGTDGSQLTVGLKDKDNPEISRSLLTPNLGTGMNNIHAKNEFVTVQDMSKCTTNILNIIDVWTEKALENKDGIIDKVLNRRKQNND